MSEGKRRRGRSPSPLVAARNRSIARAYAGSVAVAEIAKAHACSEDVVRKVAAMMGVRVGPGQGRNRRCPPVEPRARHPMHDLVSERWAQGVMLRDIAEEVGMPAQRLADYVAAYRRRRGEFPLRRRPSGRRQDKHSRTLWLSSATLATLALCADGMQGAYVDAAIAAYAVGRSPADYRASPETAPGKK